MKFFICLLCRHRNCFKICCNELSDNQKPYIEAMAGLEKKNKVARIYTVLHYNMLKQGIVQVIGELLFI